MTRDLTGGSYQMTETRKGPPLEHALEKLENAILDQYELIQNLTRYVPDDLSSDELPNIPESTSLKSAFLLSHARSSFNYQLLSFLSLNNRLGMHSESLANDLLKGNRSNLEAFLTRAEFIR